MIHTTYKKAIQYFRNGDLKTALQVAQSALFIAKDKDSIELRNLTGIIYHQSKLYQQAIEAYTKNLAIDERHILTWVNLGITYRKLNQFTEAEQCFLKALDINANSYDALSSLGLVYLFQEKVEKAIECLEKALSINTNSNMTCGNLALAYALDKNFAKAEQTLQKAIFLGFENYREIQERIKKLKHIVTIQYEGRV